MASWIKIEGLRDADTARRVLELGADAVGLVFAPSPRRVTLAAARDIMAAVEASAAERVKAGRAAPAGVGVFVNVSLDEIAHAVAATGITHVQLHGDEKPDLAGALAATGVGVIKAFRVRDAGFAKAISAFLAGVPAGAARPMPLLDAYDAAARGGTGKTFNWDLIASARRSGLMAAVEPFVLAGGLTPANVAQAIRAACPWGVDVASGVESAPGVKDLAKVRDFIQAARSAL